MENVGSILVHGNSLLFFVIAVPADVRARLEYFHIMPLLLK